MATGPIIEDKHYTIEEYFMLDEVAEEKYEYRAGKIVAMTGGTLNHSLIGVNVVTSLSNTLKDKGSKCLVTNSDAKVYIEKVRSFVYPDATVICDDPQTYKDNDNALLNPVLIVEVLSKSTAGYDRGEKFRKYRSILSFKEYVIIDQDKPIIESYYRADARLWHMISTIGLDKHLYLQSIDCHISIEAIYHNVRNLQEPDIFLD